MHQPQHQPPHQHAPGPEAPPSPECPPDGPDPAQVDPRVLGALLGRHGWLRRGGAVGRYGRWSPPGRPGTSLLVPESRAFPDCADLLEEALAALAHGGLPSAREVLLGLSVPGDEIRWEREIPQGPSGLRDEAAWPLQEQLRSAARRMLLAGALADRARAGYYGARHQAQAERSLDRVLVGPSPDGRRLTAHLPVDGGRGPVVRLHHALHAAREAVDYRWATGGMDAFDAAVAAGVSRELAEALIALVRGSEGARVTLAWAPAAGVPAGCAARPEPVEFSPGDLAVLREAAARYTRAEPAVAVRLAGAVVRMRRKGSGGGGTVRLRVLAGAEVPYVRAALDEEAYRIAGHAHLVGLPVRISGRLQRRGGFRRLTGAADVAPVPMDEVERDRLMKSLDAAFDPEDALPSD
ncbi:hypothetical protein GCM10010371_54750 [Streptomyces subrutilus]|uniref:Uncharacterized protein n=2 Tax=Streptomyces subrutilus TaxID=36818 RepID=A0A918R7S3_9ACTN|nr:hypothetical protein [Streptomyces subrutilus]WSJ29235.1 hypothetical protein OG479_07835 [Streptomyces subrutilus]GGZ87867.1 hypothetical protein GCM10010371_54750 [Streptomyces subrutilus]